MSETDLTKGREMRRKLLGDAYIDNAEANPRPIGSRAQDYKGRCHEHEY